MASIRAELNGLLRDLRRAGWQVWHGSSHWRARNPRTRQTMTIASSPNRAGLKVEQAKVRQALNRDRRLPK